jgi:hypothetical protein
LVRVTALGIVLIGFLVALMQPEGVREVRLSPEEAEQAAAEYRAAHPEDCDEPSDLGNYVSIFCEPNEGPFLRSSPVSVRRILAVVVAIVIALALLAFLSPRDAAPGRE